MSSSAETSPPRAGSYILISSSTAALDAPAPAADESARVFGSRPRLFFFLPLLAALDVATTLTLGILVLNQLAKHDEPAAHILGGPLSHDPVMTSSLPGRTDPRLDDAAWERRKIVLLVIVFSIARAFSYGIVGFSIRIRQLGVTVAAISILSTLFYVSVANLLFQARPKPGIVDKRSNSWSGVLASDAWRWPDAFRHFEPTMPILVGVQMAFTLFEWILYIAIVGVKIPPGGNPVEAKRWARDLADDPQYRRGADMHSLYLSDDGHDQDITEEVRQPLEHHDAQDGGELQEVRTQLSSPISNLSCRGKSDGSDQPLLGASSSTPRGYGSTLADPKTPQGPGSVRSVRSPVALQQHGMSRSSSALSGLYSRSPGTAELGPADRYEEVLADDDDDEDEQDGEGDEVAEGSDPDDIIDITPNRAVARKEARLRLARAALPARRASGGTLSTLNLFGGGGGSTNGSSGDAVSTRTGGGGTGGAGIFSDEAGSPLGRNAREGDVSRPALLSVATSDEASRGESLAADPSIQSSNSMTLPSSSSTRTASTRASSFKDRKFKLPKWIKRGSKKSRSTDHDV